MRIWKKNLKSCSHNLSKASNQKSSLPKVFKLTNLDEDMDEKVKIMHKFGYKCSFRHKSKLSIRSKVRGKSQNYAIIWSCSFPHNLIEASNKKKLLTKVLKLTNLN